MPHAWPTQDVEKTYASVLAAASGQTIDPMLHLHIAEYASAFRHTEYLERLHLKAVAQVSCFLDCLVVLHDAVVSIS